MQAEALGVEPERAFKVCSCSNTWLERTSTATSPSRNSLISGSVRLHDADVPVKVVKIPPAPTVGTAQRIRALQTEEIFDGRCAGDDASAARICSAAEKLDTSSDGSGARANAFGYTPSTSITYPLSPPEALDKAALEDQE